MRRALEALTRHLSLSLLVAVVVVAGIGLALDAPGEPHPQGERLFIQSGCGACHTLRAAAAAGTFAADLDRVNPDVLHVERFVYTGGVGMPSFSGLLTVEQIEAIARYVASASDR